MGKTLITTIFEGGAVIAAIHKFEPDKLVVIVPVPMGEERKKAIEKIKRKFKLIKVYLLKTKLYDIPVIVNDICKAIDKEENDVYIHMSESRKTQALAALFAGFIKKDKIKGVYYLEEETGAVLTMPLLNFRLSEIKTNILKAVKGGAKTVPSIMKKVGKQRSFVYESIKELKEDGFLSEDLKLTDAGKISVM